MNAAALQSFRHHAESAREELRSGKVTINGEELDCSLVMGAIRPEWNEKTMATQMVQKATVRIRRTLLPSCPGVGARVVLNGLEWFIERLGEQGDTALVWAIHLKRVATKTAA